MFIDFSLRITIALFTFPNWTLIFVNSVALRRTVLAVFKTGHLIVAVGYQQYKSCYATLIKHVQNEQISFREIFRAIMF